ncbi:stage V sporulation protein AD [Clostridium argentinense CDC 2741]|uniref:Stage V sporulation protein AD n=1 Tax=Clostridium argentinense CDC 2741 TaxID=1418104 RepID=A0A0C1U6I6_9CLOT|nr:stage V sporulation protein AD [Clostridium argentinense]ARC84520.1 stage V sporulation protein AD [Clostridium argentinense]KIE47378.1 stage V sporulation protein AD [Clostridium argentinense CDC 2741]NFF38696.1 stage V sporulation protein AD [Clostridium argentinense]NFP48921.1 stage V sporulation protein AD [Clostridium argentinense]NFP72929.1 stage V sporulation protein AD [Clostridium argentinense]
MAVRMGIQTVSLDSKPRIISTYNVVGPKEGDGPLKDYFDEILKDDMFGCDTFEKAESKIHYTAVSSCIKRANLKESDINYMFSGDLLNQLFSSGFMARDLDIPFMGIYGACSNMTLSMSMAAMSIESGCANYSIASTSSHFSSAERQFRLPLEMGSQRAPVSQWTVTGAGAMVISKNDDKSKPYITHITTGKVKDYGITDPNEMGAAMAPAAVDTLKQHFIDTGRKPNYYDLIATGDLGKVGKKITEELLLEYGYDISSNYIDCGDEIFDSQRQNTYSGGSGCASSGAVMTGYIYRNMLAGKFKKVLLISTGALLNSTSPLQGETIPGVAHAVSVEIGGE